MAYINRELETAAFGAIITSPRTSIVQATASYGLTEKMNPLGSAGSTQGANSDGEFFCTPAVAINTFSAIFTDRACHYQAGQGIEAIFTARFDTPRTDSQQRAGLINATDALVIAYDGNDFGILYSHHGKQEVWGLQMTGGSAGTENCTVTIDGDDYIIELTGATNANTAAIQIADKLKLEAGLVLWRFQQVEDRVLIRSIVARPSTGGFNFTSATATGNMLLQTTGVVPEEDFITATNDFSATLKAGFVPQNYNVYKIRMQYLGVIEFYVEDDVSGDFVLIHRLSYPNLHTRPAFANPSFRCGWIAANRSVANSLSVYGGSCALFVEGHSEHREQAKSTQSEKTIGTTEEAILTLQNRQTFNGRVNLGDILPYDVSASNESTNKTVTVFVRKNATVLGTQNFSYVNETGSIVICDKTGGVLDAVEKGDLIATFLLAPTDSQSIDVSAWDIFVLPGETITISAEFSSGSATVSTAIVWKEDI